MKQLIAMLSLVLLAAMAPKPAPDPDPFILGGPTWVTTKFLRKDSPNPAALFAGACSSVDPDREGVKTVFILPMGRPKGYVVDVAEPAAPITVNIGYVNFNRGQAVISEHHGGLGTNEVLRIAVQRIADTKLVRVPTYAAALALMPSVKCPAWRGWR